MLTYNHEKYIAQAIESVLMQKTNFYYEIVIGEDFSEDKTRDICDSFKEKNPDKIKLILNNSNIGMMLNMVKTLNLCKGKYIALLEGDDYWIDPYKLQKQVDFLESHDDFVLCSHAVKTVFEDGVEEKDPFVAPLEVATFDDIIERGHFIPTLSIVFRKSALPIIPYWFKNLWVGDIPLALLITHYGKNYYFKEIMGVKRKNPGGVSQNPKFKLDSDFINESKLFFFKELNSFFDYEHKKVINPKISELLLSKSKREFLRNKFGKSMQCFIQSFFYSPSGFIDKLSTLSKKSYRTTSNRKK